MTGRYFLVLDGEQADAGLLDDDAEMAGIIFDKGPHHGHKILISTAKYNCGAYEETVSCECGSRWTNNMYGCWQHGHQREESGDPALSQLFTFEYNWIDSSTQAVFLAALGVTKKTTTVAQLRRALRDAGLYY